MPFDGTQLDDVTKLLIAGRERIERGWCQHAVEDSGGRVCAVGALTRQPRSIDEGVGQALNRLARAAGQPPSRLSAWNDDPLRTKEDVLAAYDTAIMRSELVDEWKDDHG